MGNNLNTAMQIEKLLSRNLKRAYNIMHVNTNKLFREFEITVAQFDLMETILLSRDQALSIQDISSGTVSLQPNTTRMVAELENLGLVKRSSGSDRRTVIVKITARGKQLVSEIQKPLLDLHKSQYKSLTDNELNDLNELLIKISKPD